MFLSKIDVTPSDRVSLGLDTDIDAPHKLVTSGLNPNEAAPEYRYLFRDDTRSLLVQTHLKPKGWSLRFSMKEFEIRPEVGDEFRFRLRACVCKRFRNHHTNEHGKMVDVDRPLVREADQLAWLRAKGKNCGFELGGTMATYESVRVSPKRDIRLNSVLFNGILVVTNQALFDETLKTGRGLGPGKAFGFGLLSLAAH